MIARVRIAPVDRWCPQNLRDLENYPSGIKLVGLEVEILTETMQKIGDCIVLNEPGDGRVWSLTPKSVDDIAKILYPTPVDPKLMLCEHMLDLD
jgi:hypothetical protein